MDLINQIPTSVPTLETQRLTLRAFTLGDAPRVKELAGDKRISDSTLLIPYPYTLEDALSWIETHPDWAARGQGYSFALTLKTGELMGGFGLNTSLEHARAEIGYWLGIPYWNQDYTTEAARAILNWGFENLALERIQAHVFAGNTGSIRVQEKLGMTLEGKMKKYYRKGGAFLDAELRSVLLEDWPRG
jgi:[ribosomal protein S5]-alanine N-acetyltransferase